jgi:hypothetical protein
MSPRLPPVEPSARVADERVTSLGAVIDTPPVEVGDVAIVVVVVAVVVVVCPAVVVVVSPVVVVVTDDEVVAGAAVDVVVGAAVVVVVLVDGTVTICAPDVPANASVAEASAPATIDVRVLWETIAPVVSPRPRRRSG